MLEITEVERKPATIFNSSLIRGAVSDEPLSAKGVRGEEVKNLDGE
jgi:hypothetical protein